MIKILLTLPLLLIATACASVPASGAPRSDTLSSGDSLAPDSRPYFAARDEAPAIDSGPYHEHTIRPIVGYTTERQDGGFTLAAQYEYRFKKEWGAGAFADLVFGDSTAFVLGALGYWHPVENLTLVAGPGVDFDNDDVFARVGGSYDIKLKQFTIGPAVYVDLGAKSTPILAGLLASFDF